MSRLALIYNPKSHGVKTRGSMLEAIAPQLGPVQHIRIDDFSALPADVLKLSHDGVTDFIVEGGDGTLQAVISAYLSTPDQFTTTPRFAVLPGGSTNLAYKVMGPRHVSKRKLTDLLRRLQAGDDAVETTYHRALMVQAESWPTPVVGFLLSTGSLARAMVYTQDTLHGDTRRGVVSVAQAAAQLALWPNSTLFSDGEPVIRPSKFIRLDGADHGDEVDKAFSLLTTLPGLSLGLKPFWNRGDHPISFTTAAWPIVGLRRGVLKLFLGASDKVMLDHGMVSEGISEMRFRCDDPVILDGERLAMPPDGVFEVTASPALEFIR